MRLLLFTSFLCVAVTIAFSGSERGLDGADLLLTFVIHRHGDRTPVSTEKSGLPNFSENPGRDRMLSFPFGEGGLTNEGKVRGYYIGEYLRKRYNNLLSKIYYEDEIFLHSTDVERTKMTLLTSLAALYPPQHLQRWNRNLMWQPVPYTTLPQSQDFLTYFYMCPKAQQFLQGLLGAHIPEINDKHGDLLELLSNNLPFNFTEMSSTVFMYNDLVVAQAAIGVPAPTWIAPRLDDLHNAASIALAAIFKDNQVRRITGGVFLNEFFKIADDIIAEKEVKQRVRIYSAHDINVASQLAAGLLPVVVPKYGAVLSLELYRIRRTGQYIVVPVYLPQAGNSVPKILPIEGCGYFCSYDKYRSLTASYTLTLKQLVEECNE